MIALSRTARASDDEIFGVSKLIQRYAESPKNFQWNSRPRYKFWDYALAIKLIEENSIDNILDIGMEDDVVFETLLKGIANINQVHYLDLMKLSIRENKYSLVTCFGIMEHVNLKRAFFLKLIKHVCIGGVLLLTTDNESAKKNKKRIISSQDLIDLSIIAENIGYELYDLGQKEAIDYLESNKDELMSLVLRRVGR